MSLKPDVFQICFFNWLQSLQQATINSTQVDNKFLSIVGKTLRRSHEHKNGLGSINSFSAWCSEIGLTLAQVATAEKSNEITAIPEVLQLVELQNTVVTIDAMGTQKAIAKQIRDGGGMSVIACGNRY